MSAEETESWWTCRLWHAERRFSQIVDRIAAKRHIFLCAQMHPSTRAARFMRGDCHRGNDVFWFCREGILFFGFFSDWLILRLIWSLSAGNQICHQLSSPGSQKKYPKGGFGRLIIFSEESICCHGDGNAPDSVSSHTLNNSFVLHQLKQQPWKNLVLGGDSPSPLAAWLSRWVYFQHRKTKEPIRAILPAESVFLLPFNKQPSPAVDGVTTAAAAKQAAQGH